MQTLQNAREQLLSVFRSQFQEASQARDAAATSRFFKLFTVIGWEEEGLEAYSSFVVDLVRIRAPASAKSAPVLQCQQNSILNRFQPRPLCTISPCLRLFLRA